MPLFAQSPRFTFKLRSNPVKMARSIKKLLKQVTDLLAANAPNLIINHENRDYRMQFTAEGGFFTVLVKPPGDWDEDHPVAPVLLAFSLADMYLLGYQDNADGNIWKLYKDAEFLAGSGADDPANAAEWTYLPYNGGYIPEMYRVSIGLLPMYHALQTLNNPHASDMDKRLALGVFIICISEAGRFPGWKRHLVNLLRQYLTMIILYEAHRFDRHFNDWSSICKRVRKGPTRFIPGDGFDTYSLLLEAIFILLSRPPEDEL